MFEVIPAIDILGGRCVRLKQGRFDAETFYAADPVKIAKKWEAEGAKRLHVVDLDGARSGIPENIEIIKQIVKEALIPVQVGGGIRNFGLIKELTGLGVQRIILGTAAIKNPNLLSTVCQQFGERIVVSIDAKGGLVTAEGWKEVTALDIATVAREAVKLGVKRFVYTDISKDGMLEGPNFEGIRNFASEVSVPVIASGGISTLEDIQRIKEIGVEGCIVGKALYAGQIKLNEALTIG